MHVASGELKATLIGLSLYASCIAGAAAENLVATAGTDRTLSTFVAAINKTGVRELLEQAGPYTVFMPTNEAIAKFGEDKWRALEKDKNSMFQLIENHVLKGKILIAEIKPGPARTINGSTLELKSDNGKVTVQEANVIQSDVTADNGVIHAIDTVLTPAK